MNDFCPGLFLKEGRRQQANDVIPLDKLPFLVEQEAAVKVAVKGDAHIRPVLNHRIAGVCPAFRQQRVRNTVREIAVRRVVYLHEGQRDVLCLKTRFDSVHNRACRAVTCVHHQLQRLNVVDVDIGEQMVEVGFHHRHLPVAAAYGFVNRREVVGFRQALHVAQAGITADWAGALAYQLHAVVVHRVVAGGHFNPAVHVQVPGGKVNFFGTGQADIQHVHARILQAASQRLLQGFTRQAHVAAQHDGSWLQVFAVGAANAPRDIFIQFVAQAATDVVGFKTGQLLHHFAPSGNSYPTHGPEARGELWGFKG